jgi:hypothetical protein
MKLSNWVKYVNIVGATLVVAPDNPINKVLSDVFVEPRRALALHYLHALALHYLHALALHYLHALALHYLLCIVQIRHLFDGDHKYI